MKVLASLFVAGLLLMTAVPAFAHQPVDVDSEITEVIEPEISKAYYGVLSGAPHTYLISSEIEFDLYVGILVPDSERLKRDVTATIFRGDELLKSLGGVDGEWATFYEPFGQNTYWDGGEYRLRAAPGEYSVRISSPDNDSKYSLAIGEIEFFDLEDRANALAVLPRIQQRFFGSSALELVGTRYGLMNLAVIYIAALLAVLLYRVALRRLLLRLIGGTRRGVSRGYRFLAAFVLFVFAVTTTWNPLSLFVSGLLLFDTFLGRWWEESAKASARG